MKISELIKEFKQHDPNRTTTKNKIIASIAAPLVAGLVVGLITFAPRFFVGLMAILIAVLLSGLILAMMGYAIFGILQNRDKKRAETFNKIVNRLTHSKN